MNIDLSGKTALVTGGNVGIGRAIALALAGSGADVAVTYLTHGGQEVVEELKKLGRQGLALKMDGASSAEVNATVAEAAQALGGHLDIVVNNAGGLVGRVPLAEMSDEHWHRVIDINLTSAFYVTRAALPFMNRGWGRIVNMSSVAAHNGGGQGAGAYSASKAGLHALTRAMAREFAPQGITVNAVAPGLILDTPFHETFTPPEAQQAAIQGTLVKRPGLPVDVAGTVLFLCSDLAGFITGEVTEINGGSWFN